MNVKRYLKNHYYLNRKIQAKTEELTDLHLKATAIGSLDYSKDRIIFSPSPNAQYESICEEIAIREDKLRKEIATLVEQKKAINEMIETLEDADDYFVLYNRYLCYRTFEWIATSLGLSRRTVFYRHDRAIERLKKKFNNL